MQKIIVCLFSSFLCFCGLLAGGKTEVAQAEQPVHASDESLRAYVDRELYPKAYSILTSDRLMFPVDMSDWPVEIDEKRQLFVDDYLIGSRENLQREWHQVTKHPGNPIMVGQTPWEKNEQCNQIIPMHVQRDASTGKFRMWYTVNMRYEGPGGISMRFPTLYAESDDGLKWHRPNLGILEYDGSKENNLVIHGGTIFGLFENQSISGSEKRYTALVWHEPDYVEQEGYYLYTSDDGLHWTGNHSRLILPSFVGYRLPLTGIGDTSTIRYDPVLGLYVCDIKFGLPPKRTRMRCRGQCESTDLIHWTRPRMTIFPDEYDGSDAQVYSNVSFHYESMWLGLLRMMRAKPAEWKQRVDVELSMSRDGYHWVRPSQRQPFLPLGGPDSWEPDYTDVALQGPILVEDELWFYYQGGRYRLRDKLQYEAMYVMKLGLAKLRRDGFASLNAGDEPGTITSRPLSFQGRRLFINAQTAPDGWIKAAVVHRDHGPLASNEIENAIAFSGDTTREPLAWNGRETLPASTEGDIRLVFRLKNAKLYSFWIE